MKHTPGNWRADLSRYDRQWRIYEDRPNGGAPIVNDLFHSGDEQKANAHLIAAAPDLFLACRAACDCLSEILEDSDGTEGTSGEMIENPLLTQIRSAIAKAEGNDQEGRRP